MRRLCIEFRDLPPRPRSLTPAQMAGVFGGYCVENGRDCDPNRKDISCCSQNCRLWKRSERPLDAYSLMSPGASYPNEWYECT